MRLIVTASLQLVTCLCVYAQAQKAGVFTFSDKPGPYAVGLKVVEQYDFSRTFEAPPVGAGMHSQDYPGRPLQTLIWYPALPNNSKAMSAGDYIRLLSTEISFDKPASPAKGSEWARIKPVIDLKQPLRAFRDASPISNSFPVIIYAPSFSSVSWENADLCEYLASFGYVVIATPCMGVSSRETSHGVPGINAQARDISFLVGYAQSLRDADVSEIGVAAFSWGGISDLFAAARDSRIKALANLDGSMRYFPGFVQAAGDVHPEQMTIPLLFFAGQKSLEDQARCTQPGCEGPSVLNAWVHGDLILVHMLGLVHPEFCSMAQRNEELWRQDFSHIQEADYNREDGNIGYLWVAIYTLKFFDAYLKHDATALNYLKKTPAENGVPKHVMAVRFFPRA